MSQSVNVDFNGKQSPISITRLQCIINVSHIICNYDLSAGIYVSCYSVAADVHELRRATFAGTNAICDRHTGVIPNVQKEFRVIFQNAKLNSIQLQLIANTVLQIA